MLLKKNMSRFLYIFAFGTLLSVLYISDVGSALAAKSIINEIIDDKHMCPTALVLYNSAYMSQCTKINYPSVPLNISEDSFNTFLCLGLYDIGYKVCYVQSRNSNLNFLPNNKNDLGLQLNKVFQSGNDPLKFCKQQQSWKYLPVYDKVQREVTMLTNAFKEPLKCERICFDFNKKFNPLCSIWVWAAQLPIPEISTFDQQKSTLSIKNKSNKDNLISHAISTAVVFNSPISESEVTKNNKSKPNERLPSGIENNSQNLINGPEPKLPSKDDGKAQPSSTSSSGVVHHEDSEAEAASSNKDKTHENSNIKPDSSIDNTNNKELEKSAGSSIDKKNKEPSQKIENTGASINQAVTLSQYTDDQKNINQEDLSGDHYEAEDTTDMVQELSNSGPSLPKPSEIKDTFPRNLSMRTEDDSHFLTYFVVITLLCIGGYVGYHNKQKVLAIFLEGRRSRGSRGRRRPNTASYRKLDCTLEEAVTSQCNSNVTHVIY